MKHRSGIWMIGLVLAAWVLAACGPLGGSAAGDLNGTSWRLSSYRNAAGQTVAVLPGTEVTADFQDGGLGGNATCNSYFGEYVVKGSQLTIQGVGMTEMYCMPDENMEQEAAYLAALGTAAGYEVDGPRLTITDASGQILLTFAAR